MVALRLLHDATDALVLMCHDHDPTKLCVLQVRPRRELRFFATTPRLGVKAVLQIKQRVKRWRELAAIDTSKLGEQHQGIGAAERAVWRP